MFTEQQVKDAGFKVGIPDDKAEAFYHYYNAQGWLFGNGLQVTSLASALVRWRNNAFRFEKKDRKQKLWPIPGKVCSLNKCGMPAVYKTTGGDYDSFRCSLHLPETVKELYE